MAFNITFWPGWNEMECFWVIDCLIILAPPFCKLAATFSWICFFCSTICSSVKSWGPESKTKKKNQHALITIAENSRFNFIWCKLGDWMYSFVVNVSSFSQYFTPIWCVPLFHQCIDNVLQSLIALFNLNCMWVMKLATLMQWSYLALRFRVVLSAMHSFAIEMNYCIFNTLCYKLFSIICVIDILNKRNQMNKNCKARTTHLPLLLASSLFSKIPAHSLLL